MYCNRPVIITAIVGLLGLSLIFMFDPTHDYPTLQDVIDLVPGASQTIKIPTTSSSFMQWSGALIGSPHLWVTSASNNLMLVDFAKILAAGVQLGIPINSTQAKNGSVIVMNIGNTTILSNITFTLAPSPTTLGTAKTWWYIIFAVLQSIIGSIIALIKPSSQVITRSPASGSLAASTNAQQPCKRRACCPSCIPNIFRKNKKTPIKADVLDMATV